MSCSPTSNKKHGPDTGTPDSGTDLVTDIPQDTTQDIPDAGDVQDAWIPDSDTPDAEVPEPLEDNTLPDWDWARKVHAVAERASLGAAFDAAGYTPPPGTLVFAGTVVPGLGQPAFVFHSMQEQGFIGSWGNFWPASTIKLLAAVGALHKLSEVSCDSGASISFSDDDGTYNGTVTNLIDLAIRISDNVAYNRLMLIGGFEEINGSLLDAAFGMPTMVLQRRYTRPFPESNLRTSPPMQYTQGTVSGTLPERLGTSTFPECPNEANCITLAELVEGLRRVVLHEEIPTSERFTLSPADLQVLHTALLAASTKFQPGIGNALPGPLRIYNKTGQVYDNDRLDHAFIVQENTGRIFFLAASMPYNTTNDGHMSLLAQQTLSALLSDPGPRVRLQVDFGVPIRIRTQYLGPGCQQGTELVSLQVQAEGADRVELFMDRWPLDEPMFDGHLFRMQRDFSSTGERLMTVYAYAQDTLVGVRHATVRIGP